MKYLKKSIFLVLLLSFSNFNQAQNEKRDAILEGQKTRFVLNFIAGPVVTINNDDKFTMVTSYKADFEVPTPVKALSLGAYAGVSTLYFSKRERENGITYDSLGHFVRNYSDTTIFRKSKISVVGVVGRFYFDKIIRSLPAKYDLFVSLKVGYMYPENNVAREILVVPLDFNILVGGRYNFTKYTAIYIGAGYGTTTSFDLGLSLKI